MRHQALRPIDKEISIKLDPATRLGVDFHHPTADPFCIELGVDRPVKRVRKVNSPAVAAYLNHLGSPRQSPRPAEVRCF